jgi:hypothetical protein
MIDLNDPMLEFVRDDRVFLMDSYEDRVDPRLPWSFAGTRDRDRLAGALRQLADVFTSRHDLPIPKDGYVRLDVIADGERRIAEIAHGPAGYLFKVLPGAFEQAPDAKDAERGAPRLAATDTPEAARRPGSPPDAAASRQRRPPQPDTVPRNGRKRQ